MSDAPQATWVARDKSVEQLVFACARGEISWDTLSRAFSERGWSTRYLYEAVRNAEYHIEAQAHLATPEREP